MKVRPLCFTAHIGQNAVQVLGEEVASAISPGSAAEPFVIDFEGRFSDGRASSWSEGIDALQQAVGAVQRTGGEPLAIFGFAPIPFLVALGHILGDKTAAAVYERHRHRDGRVPPEAWSWEADGPDLAWAPVQKPRIQRDAKDVAVLLSISGRVDVAAVAAILPHQHPQYEIRLEEPRVNVIRTRGQLGAFVIRWREVLEHIRDSYGDSVRVHVFSAVPLSVAVECGRRMIQSDPSLRIYNAVGSTFRYALTVGPNCVWREPEATISDKADLVVLVALEEEFEQLYALLPSPVAVPDPTHGGCDYVWEIGDRQVVARLVGAMGSGDAQLVADRSIERWRPQTAVWVGIAAGIHKDVRLADVVVPDQIDGYDANLKAVDDGDGDYDFQERGEVFRSDHALVQAVQNFRFSHGAAYEAWARACAEDLDNELSDRRADVSENEARRRPVIKVGHIASGNVVGAAEAFTKRLHRRDASLLGLEMETVGLSRAAHKRVQTVRVLALRGVSDFGDSRKVLLDGIGGGIFRRVAMRNASRLLLSLIEAGLL